MAGNSFNKSTTKIYKGSLRAIADDLKAKGLKVDYYKRANGSIVVKSINGIKYKGYEGNAALKNINPNQVFNGKINGLSARKHNQLNTINRANQVRHFNKIMQEKDIEKVYKSVKNSINYRHKKGQSDEVMHKTLKQRRKYLPDDIIRQTLINKLAKSYGFITQGLKDYLQSCIRDNCYTNLGDSYETALHNANIRESIRDYIDANVILWDDFEVIRRAMYGYIRAIDDDTERALAVLSLFNRVLNLGFTIDTGIYYN